jgi:hypothetical protein
MNGGPPGADKLALGNAVRREEARMQYVGIDSAYRRAGWCAKQADGTISGERFAPADEDGLARLVIEPGSELRACLELMSGAIWVRDRLAGAGCRSSWQPRARSSTSPRSLARPTRSPPAGSLSAAAASSCPRSGSRRSRSGRRASGRGAGSTSSASGARPRSAASACSPNGAQDPARSSAPTRRDGAARDTRCARGLAWPRRSR